MQGEIECLVERINELKYRKRQMVDLRESAKADLVSILVEVDPSFARIEERIGDTKDSIKRFNHDLSAYRGQIEKLNLLLSILIDEKKAILQNIGVDIDYTD